MLKAYTNRGNAKVARFADTTMPLPIMNQAIRINPQDAEGLLPTEEMPRLLLTADDHDAIADYDQAIRINPQDAVAYYNRGTAKVARLARHDDAIADYDRGNPHQSANMPKLTPT